MNYSKAIRVARSLADISQAQLADRAEIDRSYLSLIESGKRTPSLDTIEKIAKALDMPFHLFSLLGSEEADVKNASHEQIASLSMELTKLLFEVSRESPSEKPKRRRTIKNPDTKPPRPRVSSRGGSGDSPSPRKRMAK